MTIRDREDAAADLRKKLDPKNVVKPTGSFGPKGDYIEGWFAIQEANRIFGEFGWEYTIDLQKVCEFTNEKGNIEIGFTCICTVSALGVTRQDVGFGSGAAKKQGDAYEGAVKEAVTDALKRTLRTFGNPFGLALYDKSRENVGVDVPALPTVLKDIAAAPDLPALRAIYGATSKAYGTDEDWKAAMDKRRATLTTQKEQAA